MISDYEYDNIWMSARYCIGRSTIASSMHAEDIAQNSVDNMDDHQKEIIAKIINEAILDHFKYGQIVINVPFPDLYELNPFEIVNKMLDHIYINGYQHNFKCDSITYTEDGKISVKANDKSLLLTLMPITDLLPWYNLRSLMNEKYHYNITINFNGEQTIKCFEYWTFDIESYRFVKRYHPVKDKLSGRYLNPKYITNEQKLS